MANVRERMAVIYDEIPSSRIQCYMQRREYEEGSSIFLRGFLLLGLNSSVFTLGFLVYDLYNKAP